MYGRGYSGYELDLLDLCYMFSTAWNNLKASPYLLFIYPYLLSDSGLF